MPPAFAWIEYAFWGVLAVGILAPCRSRCSAAARAAGRTPCVPPSGPS